MVGDPANLLVLLVYLQGAAVIFRLGVVGTIIVDHSVKVGASHTPSQTHLPLTSQSPRTHRWVPSHSLTASCAFCVAGWCQALKS